MKRFIFYTAFIIGAIRLTAQTQPLRLWYDKPAQKWTDALPIGMSESRHYRIPASAWKKGSNVIAVQVLNYFDKGGFVGLRSGQKAFVIYPEGGTPENGAPIPLDWKYRVQDNTPPIFPCYEADYLPFGDLWLQIQKINDRTLELSIKVRNGVLRANSYLYVVADKGTVTVSDGKITLQKANAATFYLVAATNC